MEEKKEVKEVQKQEQLANPSTNSQIPVQEGNIKEPQPVQSTHPKRRVIKIDDIINFDGELYRVYKIKNDGKKVGLCRLSREEQHKVRLKIQAQQEAAIRRAKELGVDQRRVIDMPPVKQPEEAVK